MIKHGANIVKTEHNRESLLSKIVEVHPIFAFYANIMTIMEQCLFVRNKTDKPSGVFFVFNIFRYF